MAPKMNTERKLNALRAAHEWLGMYDAEDGQIAQGGTEGIAEDLLDAYDLLAEMIDAAYARHLEEYAVARIRELNPTAGAVAIRHTARGVVKANPPAPATRSERSA